MENFVEHIQNNIKHYWNIGALTDINGSTYKYSDVATEIAKLHVLFDKFGIEKGDKIAICSRNMSRWGIAFLSIVSYGAVAVPLLHEFTPESIHHLVNHSDSRLLFVSDEIWRHLNGEQMPKLLSVISLNTNSLLNCRDIMIMEWKENLDKLFAKKYPQGFHPENVEYYIADLDDLALINYTSGTTSAPKGVMLTYRNLSSNVEFALKNMPNNPGDHILAMLPMAHMYGLAFDFLFQMSSGCHVFFLDKAPSPTVLLKAFAQVKPYLIVTVPLVIDKIFKKQVIPSMEKKMTKFFLNVPMLNVFIKNKIKNRVLAAFGGNLTELIVGGAAISQDVEDCMKSIGFPYTVGYGMTECAPLICYSDYTTFVKGSCGRIVDNMEIRIDSTNINSIPGEIQVKGSCVMKGYFKNEEATKATFTDDGWLRTGDLGIMDQSGNLFIKGRSKNMILGPSGQNIFPEEIEDKLNNLSLVCESVVVERDKRIVALVYPDKELIRKEALDEMKLNQLMTAQLSLINKELPVYSQISKIELVDEEFEKTPKRSIKRFLYK